MVALFIVIVLPMVTLPPPEVRFQVEFRIGQDPHDLNRLLTHLELGDIDFDINGLIFSSDVAGCKGSRLTSDRPFHALGALG